MIERYVRLNDQIKPLFGEKHINRFPRHAEPKFSVKVGTSDGETVVFYYCKDQRFLGWAMSTEEVSTSARPVDNSILSPDRETIIKVEFEDAKIIAMADCAGGPMTAPCMIVLREHRNGSYKLHYWNEQTNSYFQGYYDLTIERAIILFGEKVMKERQSAKDQGLPPIRVWFFHSLLGEGPITEFTQLRRW